jgi:hypothetical protein
MKSNTPDANQQVCPSLFDSGGLVQGCLTMLQRGVIINTASIAAMDGQVRGPLASIFPRTSLPPLAMRSHSSFLPFSYALSLLFVICMLFIHAPLIIICPLSLCTPYHYIPLIIIYPYSLFHLASLLQIGQAAYR